MHYYITTILCVSYCIGIYVSMQHSKFPLSDSMFLVVQSQAHVTRVFKHVFAEIMCPLEEITNGVISYAPDTMPDYRIQGRIQDLRKGGSYERDTAPKFLGGHAHFYMPRPLINRDPLYKQSHSSCMSALVRS